jgi:hypothetical protein
VIAELARRLSGTLGPTAKASTAIHTLAVKLGPCDAQVCGTFKSCKSYFNRTKLQRNLNNIGVRSFILTGAPINKINDLADDLATVATAISDSSVSQAAYDLRPLQCLAGLNPQNPVAFPVGNLADSTG